MAAAVLLLTGCADSDKKPVEESTTAVSTAAETTVTAAAPDGTAPTVSISEIQTKTEVSQTETAAVSEAQSIVHVVITTAAETETATETETTAEQKHTTAHMPAANAKEAVENAVNAWLDHDMDALIKATNVNDLLAVNALDPPIHYYESYENAEEFLTILMYDYDYVRGAFSSFSNYEDKDEELLRRYKSQLEKLMTDREEADRNGFPEKVQKIDRIMNYISGVSAFGTIDVKYKTPDGADSFAAMTAVCRNGEWLLDTYLSNLCLQEAKPQQKPEIQEPEIDNPPAQTGSVAAKVYNALQCSITDMDSIDLNVRDLGEQIIRTTGKEIAAAETPDVKDLRRNGLTLPYQPAVEVSVLQQYLLALSKTYFPEIVDVDELCFMFTKNVGSLAVAVKKDGEITTYPECDRTFTNLYEALVAAADKIESN